jgi:hypothetical protein
MVRRDEAGKVTAREAERSGPAVWSGRLGPHALESVGKTVIHVVSVEVKG